MVQDNVSICPKCGGLIRKIYTDKNITFVCKFCVISLKVIDYGQSQREVKCQIQ